MTNDADAIRFAVVSVIDAAGDRGVTLDALIDALADLPGAFEKFGDATKADVQGVVVELFAEDLIERDPTTGHWAIAQHTRRETA